MTISDDIAGLNYDRYQSFITNEDGAAEKAVVECNTFHPSSSDFKITSFIFDGPAYRGFDACSFNSQQYNHAQQVQSQCTPLRLTFLFSHPTSLPYSHSPTVLFCSIFSCSGLINTIQYMT